MMETLIMTLLLIGVAYSMFKDSHTPAEATAAVGAGAPAGATFVRTETVTVDDPSELGDAINRICRKHTDGGWSSTNTVGTPHISPDGLTANVPLLRVDA